MALDDLIRANSINYTLFSLGIIAILVMLSIFLRQKSEVLKYILFGGFVLVILANTLYLTGSTLYLNSVSATGGPVHFHADFEIWNCGKEVALKDPEGLSNKIGSSVIHEHNDKRIHLEGVLLSEEDASIGRFFKEVGGSLTEEKLTLPTDNGLLSLETGQECSGVSAELQVFVYQTNGGIYTQQKLTNPQDYTISPESAVPPGDCIIIELDAPKETTDKLCEQYKVKEGLGEIRGY